MMALISNDRRSFFTQSNYYSRRNSSSAISKRRQEASVDKRGWEQRSRFIDKTRIQATGGTGGSGCLSNQRLAENYKLIPNGGHGGSGGSVLIVAHKDASSLRFSRKHFTAPHGGKGKSSDMRGRSGKNLIVRVPCGVVVKRVLEYDQEWDSVKQCVIQKDIQETEPSMKEDPPPDEQEDIVLPPSSGKNFWFAEDDYYGPEKEDESNMDVLGEDNESDEGIDSEVEATEGEDDNGIDPKEETKEVRKKKQNQNRKKSKGRDEVEYDSDDLGLDDDDSDTMNWTDADWERYILQAEAKIKAKEKQQKSYAKQAWEEADWRNDELYDDDDDSMKKEDLGPRPLVQLADLDQHGAYVMVARGGRGGVGSSAYKKRHGTIRPSPEVMADRAAPEMGEVVRLELELKLIADIGLVGFPNAGKSSLLRAMSRATPKVAPYPFTTLHPLIGMIEYRDGLRIRAADLPGLITGASQGRGMGLEFLRHIERTKALMYVLDAPGTDGRNPFDDLRTLVEELQSYKDGDLLERRAIILANKTDLMDPAAVPELLDSLTTFADELGIQRFSDVHGVSAGVTGAGLGPLSKAIREVVLKVDEEQKLALEEAQKMIAGENL